VKITDAKVLVCCPGRNFLTLNIFTDEGHTGLGGATLNGRELPVGSYLTDHVIPCLIGRDPFQTEDLLRYLYRGVYWRGGPVTMTAIGAVDMALWDIKDKALNTPAYNLLEGESRTGVLGSFPTSGRTCP
jgi:mannonate dehydratase